MIRWDWRSSWECCYSSCLLDMLKVMRYVMEHRSTVSRVCGIGRRPLKRHENAVSFNSVAHSLYFKLPLKICWFSNSPRFVVSKGLDFQLLSRFVICRCWFESSPSYRLSGLMFYVVFLSPSRELYRDGIIVYSEGKLWPWQHGRWSLISGRSMEWGHTCPVKDVITFCHSILVAIC